MFLLLRVSFNDLLLLCCRTDVLLSTTASFLFKDIELMDNGFSSVFCGLSPCGASYEDDLLTVIFFKKLRLVDVSSLVNSGGDNKPCTLSVCVEMSLVVLGIIGGESDVDNLGFLIL